MKKIDLNLIFKGKSEKEKFRLYRELWSEAENYRVQTNFPMHLDIELSGICNLKCKDCFQNGLIERPLGFMKYQLFKSIIDEGKRKGLCAIKLQVRGESFLHPMLLECISYAKETGVLDIQITTNGTLLDKNYSLKILDSGLDGLILSIDDQHLNSYKHRYKTHNYSHVERAIKDFLELRAQLHKSKPWVRLQTAIPEIDILAVQRARDYVKSKFPEADIISINRIQNFREDVDVYPDLHINYELNPCSYPMQRLTIFWNGEVTTCCVDYNNRFQLGDMGRHSIEEIWSSEKINQIRTKHINGKRKTMPICRHCHACSVPISDENISSFID